jgi:CheY-like chemotaxis protein
MAYKCALIVDDSRTAREVLRRMLEAHELRVETAESAEAALEFLSSQRPDVIFMDHMMPGMDGFQAVKAIKENPATATIPVMMYTSQSGDLYVGQARALGAVGVLPKQIKPVEVTEVLRSLRLLPGAEPVPARRASDSPSGLSGIESVHSPADWSDLHRWLQEMLADHNRSLRTDLETTVRQVLAERPDPQSAATPPAARGSQLPFWPAGALVVVLAVAAAVSFWLHLDSETRWRAVARQNLGLIRALGEQQAGSVQDAGELPPVAQYRASRDGSCRPQLPLRWNGASTRRRAIRLMSCPSVTRGSKCSRACSTACTRWISGAPSGSKAMSATSACGAPAMPAGSWLPMNCPSHAVTAWGCQPVKRAPNPAGSRWRLRTISPTPPSTAAPSASRPMPSATPSRSSPIPQPPTA